MGSKINCYDMTDEELIFLISQNNDDAKDYLYEKYDSLIKNEINKFKKKAYILGVDSSDLKQEALLGFSNALYSYKDDENAKFSTYAVLCIRRRLVNYVNKFETKKSEIMKKSISLEEISETYGEDYVSFLKDEVGEPLNKLITQEDLEEFIEKYNVRLSGEEKDILNLIAKGKSHKEIAFEMEMPLKKVYNIVHRARKKIKID